MSYRPQIAPFSVITSGDMSQTSLTSSVSIIQKISIVSYAYSWSGTSPVGTITVQVSNDYSLEPNGKVNNTGTWTGVYFYVAGSLAASISVSGNTGTAFLSIEGLGAYAIRTVYTKVSGTGTLQAVVAGKVS